jgi:hypothetical protein
MLFLGYRRRYPEEHLNLFSRLIMSEAILPGSLAPSRLAQKELSSHISISFTVVRNVTLTNKWLAIDQKMTSKLSLGQVTLIRTTFYETTTAPSNLDRIFFPSRPNQLLYEDAN